MCGVLHCVSRASWRFKEAGSGVFISWVGEFNREGKEGGSWLGWSLSDIYGRQQAWRLVQSTSPRPAPSREDAGVHVDFLHLIEIPDGISLISDSQGTDIAVERPCDLQNPIKYQPMVCTLCCPSARTATPSHTLP